MRSAFEFVQQPVAGLADHQQKFAGPRRGVLFAVNARHRSDQLRGNAVVEGGRVARRHLPSIPHMESFSTTSFMTQPA